MSGTRKLQWALLAAGVPLLVGLVAERVGTLRVAAEQVAFQHAVAALRANVTAAATRALVARDAGGLAALDRSDPRALLPGGAPDVVGGEGGGPGWRYDERARELVYVPRFPEGFVGGRGRVRVRLDYHDRDRDGVYSPGRDRLRGVGLVVVAGPSWSPNGR